MPEGKSGGWEEFWASIPEKAEHPSRIPILEALRWIGEPLSAVDLVDVADGENITMWEAAHHLRALDALDVVEACPAARDPFARRDVFDLPYRLKVPDTAKGN